MSVEGKNPGILEWIESKQSKGLYYFTREEALSGLKMDKKAFDQAIFRLVGKNKVVSVYRGFYLIIPVEYKSWGVLPADWFIADLMAYLGQPYYAGLLTAALYHGASQKPQVFLVVTNKPVRPVTCNRVKIKFLVKKNIANTPVDRVNTRTGYMNVSTPEATAIDLLRYLYNSGGLGHVLTVLQELGEKIDPDKLRDAAKIDGCIAYAQRLGWLLDKTEYAAKTAKLAKWVDAKEPAIIALDPRIPIKKSGKDLRWRLWLNTNVEGDLQ
jgi:predicted transcriptional regulator of viral defense system